MQEHRVGVQHLTFTCKALKPSEQCYSVYKGELAAVFYCFIRCRHCLEGCLGGLLWWRIINPLLP